MTLTTRRNRALFVTVGTDNVASSRVRAGTVIKTLQEWGWDTSRVVSSSRIWFVVTYWKLLRYRQHLVCFQKVAPPRWFTHLVRFRATWLIFEVDDAIHLGYPGSTAPRRKSFCRVQTVARVSDRVVTSNVKLGEDLASMGAKEVRIFPGPAPIVRPSSTRVTPPIVVWLGSPSTFPLVAPVEDALTPSARDGEYRLFFIGTTGSFERSAGVTYLEWSPENEQSVLSRARIGLLPAQVGEWEERKAAYKVLEYLAYGVRPVCPDSPALRSLLGDEYDTLISVVPAPESSDVWLSAVRSALKVANDEKWVSARDRLFQHWSIARFANLFLPTSETGV